MDDRDFQPRSGIPAKHVFFAIFLAGIVAVAGSGWMMEKAQKPSSAVLGFDSETAQRLYPGLISAREPAIAVADSILTDSTIAGLAKTAHLASTTPAAQLGEFRADLELTQPSPQELQVRFVDAVPAPWAAKLPAPMLDLGTNPSADTANAVARALASWTPSQPAAPTTVPASPAQSQSSPEPAAAGTSAVHPPPAIAAAGRPSKTEPPDPVADGLGQVGALLGAAGRDLDRLGAAAGGRGHHAESSYTESAEQHLLNTQVRVAERQINQLRAQAGTGEVKTQLAQAQEAVRSILGVRHAGISASQLRRERAALGRAITVVQQEQAKIQQIESAQTGQRSGTPAPAERTGAAGPAASSAAAPTANSAPSLPAAPSSAPAASTTSSSPVQEQNLSPAGDTDSLPPSEVGNPLSVIRLASPPEAPRLWIPILAGGLCGLVYLGLAALAFRHASSDHWDGYGESEFPARFITPAGPVQSPSGPIRTADRPAPEPAGEEAMPRRRTAFAMASHPAEGAVPPSAPLPRQQQWTVVMEEEPRVKKNDSPFSAEDTALAERLRRAISEAS